MIEDILYRTPKERIEIAMTQINILAKDLEKYEKLNAELRAELQKPTDEKLEKAYAEIKKLKEELREINRNSLFVLDGKYKKRAQKIWSEHAETCSRGLHSYYYQVHPTSIGSTVYFCCPCGFREEVAGVADW